MSFIRQTDCGTNGHSGNRFAAVLATVLTALAAAGAVAALGLLLYSACCAFTWKNFLMSDYGVYTNTIWNLGRGNGFHFLIDHNYLTTHLSFSLVLLGPFFRVWDHPMLLIVVQWLFLVGGASILFALARRLLVPGTLTAAVLFFFCAYPWTQSVMLSEFHGVAAYFLLIPWLIYCLSFHKALVALPLAFILGLREDSGLLLPFVFIYFAVRDRWKPGYAWAVAAIAYTIVAVTCLYPYINGRHLFDVRMGEGEAFMLLDSLHIEGLAARLRASLWAILPVLPFLALFRGAWKPLFIVPAAAYLVAMASGIPRQHGLLFHYPAAIGALTAVSMILAAPRSLTAGNTARAIIAAACLFAVTVAGHLLNGYLPGGAESHRDYRTLQDDGIMTLKIARSIPGSGRLVCNQHLAVFAANRKDIATWRYWKRDEHPADLFFCNLLEFEQPDRPELVAGLRDGSFGVHSEAFPYFVLQRGAPADLTPDLLRMIDAHTLMVSMMTMGGGANRIVPGVGLVRYWEGDGRKAPFPLAHGTFVSLEPGSYTVTFRYRASPPVRQVLGSWGWFSLWKRGAGEAAVRAAIDERSDAAFTEQTLLLQLAAPARVEPRVEAGDAELWVLSVSFRKIDPSGDTQPEQRSGLEDDERDNIGQ